MQAKHTIAIIGATGNMGNAIAKSLAKSTHRLLLFGREEEQVTALINGILQTSPSADLQGINCPVDAGWEADIIILAVPYLQEKAIAERLKTVANQKIVISIASPFNDTFDALLTATDTSAAEELQLLLPNSKVVKAFNTSFAANFVSPVIDGKQADAFIAGNNEEAVQTVAALVSIAGFNPIIAGRLSISRTLEQMQLLLVQLGIKYNYNWLAGWKILHH